MKLPAVLYFTHFSFNVKFPAFLSLSVSTGSINVTVDGKDVLQTTFEGTEIMSTYLLAFVVCEFGFLENKTDAGVLVIITVYTLMWTEM